MGAWFTLGLFMCHQLPDTDPQGQALRSNSRGGFILLTREEAQVSEWEMFICICVSLMEEITASE